MHIHESYTARLSFTETSIWRTTVIAGVNALTHVAQTTLDSHCVLMPTIERYIEARIIDILASAKIIESLTMNDDT